MEEKESDFQNCHIVFRMSIFQQKIIRHGKKIRKYGHTQEKNSIEIVPEEAQTWDLKRL